MCQKLLIGHLISILVILAPKKDKKVAFQNPNFGPAGNKKAIETLFQANLSLWKSMGGIVIDLLEKSTFFWVIWITKRCQKQGFYSGRALKAPPYGRVNDKNIDIDKFTMF